MKKTILFILIAIILLGFLTMGELTGFATNFPSAPSSPSAPSTPTLPECDCTSGECCDGCYFKSAGTSCGINKECDTIGNCIEKISSCTDDCSSLDSKECSGSSYKTCGNYDSDSCLEWSALVSCLPSEQCTSGSCVKQCTEEDWSFSLAPVDCPASSKQTKTWSKIGQCLGGISKQSSEEITCDYQSPSCNDFTFSDWSECSESSVQTRLVTSSSPQGCQGGNPLISQSCVYIPECTEANWVSVIHPENCPASGKQTKTWTKVGDCAGGIAKPSSEEITCEYQSPSCNSFTFSDWSVCSESGTQTRRVTSSSPQGCQGGNPLVTATCDYIPFCVANQTILCDNVENGVASGHKNKCNEAGKAWKNENTCQISCNSGFTKNFDKCVKIQEHKNKLTKKQLVSKQLRNTTLLREAATNETFFELAGIVESNFFENVEIIRSDINESKEYIIIKNLDLNNITKPIFALGKVTKTVWIARKNSNSNAVCVKDESNLDSLSQILASCIRIACPGSYQNYSCRIQGNYLVVSGLKNSGVVEDYSYCGDGTCLGAESCSSCSQDCGSCPVTQTSSNIGGGGGGSSSSSGSSSRSSSTSSGAGSQTNIQRDFSGTAAPQDDYASQNIDSSSSDDKGSGKIIFWIAGILILLILIIIVIILLVVARRRKKEATRTVIAPQAVSPIILPVDNSSRRIEELLLEGERLIQANRKDEAREKYKEISQIYSSIKQVNPELYKRILEFYSKLTF